MRIRCYLTLRRHDKLLSIRGDGFVCLRCGYRKGTWNPMARR